MDYSTNIILRNGSLKDNSSAINIKSKYVKPQSTTKFYNIDMLKYDYNNDIIKNRYYINRTHATLSSNGINNKYTSYFNGKPDLNNNINHKDYHLNNRQNKTIPCSLSQDIIPQAKQYNNMIKNNYNSKHQFNYRDMKEVKKSIEEIKNFQIKILSLLECQKPKEEINIEQKDEKEEEIKNNNDKENEIIINKLKEENDSIKKEITILQKNEEENKKIIESSQKEIEDLKNEIKNIKEIYNVKISENIENKDKQIKDLRKSSEEKNTKINDLKESLNKSEKEKIEMHQKLFKKNNEVKQYINKIKKLEEELNKIKNVNSTIPINSLKISTSAVIQNPITFNSENINYK